jgi:hypothetical protein
VQPCFASFSATDNRPQRRGQNSFKYRRLQKSHFFLTVLFQPSKYFAFFLI